MEKYLKTSSVFPKAGRGSLVLISSSLAMGLYLDLLCQGFVVIGVARQGISRSTISYKISLSSGT